MSGLELTEYENSMAPEKHGSLRGASGTGKSNGIIAAPLTTPTKYQSPKRSHAELQLLSKINPKTRTENGIITLRYEDSIAAKPPIPVTIAPPRAPPTDTHPALRRPMSAVPEAKMVEEERKRDSGLAPTTTSSKRGTGSVKTVEESPLGVVINFNSTPTAQPAVSPIRSVTPEKETPASPTTPKTIKRGSVGSGIRWRPGSRKNSVSQAPDTPKEEFLPITTPIPTESLLDEGFLDGMSFSKRGSIMLGGKKGVNGHARPNVGRRYVNISKRVLMTNEFSGNRVSQC